MGTVARRHHTVPRFYLERFADGRSIGTVELPGDKRYTQSVTRATARNNFYSLKVGEDVPEDAFEQVLSVIEGAAAEVIRRVVDDDQWPLGPDDRRLLAEFAAVQYLRGPDQRERMDNIASTWTKLELGLNGRESVFAYARDKIGRDITEEEADQLWAQVISEDGPPIRHTAIAHVTQIVETLPEIFPYFLGRPWSLFRFERKSLLTCDTPVALVPRADADPHDGVGLINAWAITFPLSRRVGLLMADPMPFTEHIDFEGVAEGRIDLRQQPSAAYANMFNEATRWNARRWIFHHPEDAAAVGDGLPEPRDREMEATNMDVVTMGEQMRAHQAETDES